MKITDIEAIYVSQRVIRGQCDSGQDALIVKVSTDAGITGLGEVDSAPLAAKAVIEGPFSHTISTGLKHLLIGEDPFETERLWHKMYQRTIYSGRRGIGLHAMSGIDLALWDIKGKALGLPVWKLLGGGFQKKIRCYASSLFGATPRKTGELARRIRDRGFDAVKFGWAPMGKDAKTDVDLVRQARRGLGDDADLMIDAGLVWDARTAIQRAKAFADFNSSGSRNRSRPTTTKATRNSPRRVPSTSPPASRRAGARHFSTSWTRAAWTSCRWISRAEPRSVQKAISYQYQ